MKIKPIIAVAPVMFALLTGCTWDSSPINTLWSHHPLSTLSALSNGDIIQEMIVLNRAEIATAKLAKIKSHCPKVRRYAMTLQTQHTQNLKQIQHISHKIGIAPVTNPAATHLEHHGQAELARLKLLHNTAFDKAYIQDMVTDHRTAIDVIDQALIQSSNNTLTTYLKSTREHVMMHLHRAEALQKELGSN